MEAQTVKDGLHGSLRTGAQNQDCTCEACQTHPAHPEYALDMNQFCTLRDAGGIVEIDEELFYYFLEVLPPAWMNRTVKMPDGREQRTAFGFAEGWEKVTAFWTHRDGETTRYYAQQTGILNPNRW